MPNINVNVLEKLLSDFKVIAHSTTFGRGTIIKVDRINNSIRFKPDSCPHVFKYDFDGKCISFLTDVKNQPQTLFFNEEMTQTTPIVPSIIPGQMYLTYLVLDDGSAFDVMVAESEDDKCVKGTPLGLAIRREYSKKHYIFKRIKVVEEE